MPELQLAENLTPSQALKVLRLLWAGLLGMQLVIAAVVLVVVQADPPTADTSLRQLLLLIAVAVLCVLTPVGLFARNQTYKAHWRADVITPAGYVKGNVILFAMLEGAATVALVLMVVTGLHLGLLAVAAVAVLVQLVNFPNGRPMQPREPALPEPEKL